jgi:molybdopterin-guanine dinucleotide biosynthesis protein A
MHVRPDPTLLVAILNGGASRRFGRDKAATRVGTTTALSRVLAAAAPLTPHRAVIGRETVVPMGVRLLPDATPGEGPLPALLLAFDLAAALGATRLLALPCDLPRVTTAHLELLAAPLAGDLARVPIIGGTPTPLPALYAAAAKDAFRDLQRAGRRALRPALEAISWAALDASDFTDASLDPYGLDDFDTPDELDALLAR